MKTVVFLGPSLSLAEARRVHPSAVFLPPARQSDLLSAVTTHRPDVIGLVDGVFGQSLSVWHKEILFALEKGITLLGASSLGALRAVETAAFGMIGVGEIHRMFADGELTDDDEVALVHGDADSGHRALSEPMVNIRKTLARARDEGVLDAATHDALIALAKETYFPERSFPQMLRAARAAGLPGDQLERLQAFLPSGYVNVKRDDAIALLEMARDLPERRAPVAGFSVVRSHLFEALYNRDRTVRRDGVDVPLSSIGAWAALHTPDFDELNAHALNRELVGVLADLLDVRAGEDEIDAEHARFRRRRGLETTAEVDAWLEANDLDAGELRALVAELATCRKLHRWLITRKHFERTTKIVLDELRLSGRYAEAAEGAALTERLINQSFPVFQETVRSDLGVEQLLREHVDATACRVHTTVETWAEEVGFKDTIELRYELLRERLARQALDDVVGELRAALSGQR
ncbi:Hypothetical protein A7982_01711 [Minicystis rosea]|nr:Hypothetical protein A7982_01711 [Minicystis rosea]